MSDTRQSTALSMESDMTDIKILRKLPIWSYSNHETHQQAVEAIKQFARKYEMQNMSGLFERITSLEKKKLSD